MKSSAKLIAGRDRVDGAIDLHLGHSGATRDEDVVHEHEGCTDRMLASTHRPSRGELPPDGRVDARHRRGGAPVVDVAVTGASRSRRDPGTVSPREHDDGAGSSRFPVGVPGSGSEVSWLNRERLCRLGRRCTLVDEKEEHQDRREGSARRRSSVRRRSRGGNGHRLTLRGGRHRPEGRMAGGLFGAPPGTDPGPALVSVV